MSDGKSPEFEFIFKNTLPVCVDLSHAFEEQDSIDGRIQFLKDGLEQHHDAFLKYVQSLSAKKSESDVKQLSMETEIRRYGTQNTYDLLLCIQFWQSLHQKPFVWDEQTGKPAVMPDQFIPFAIKTRDIAGDDSPSARQAFVAGWVFDLISQISQKICPHNKVVQKLMTSQYEDALEVAERALKLAKTAKSLELSKYLLSTILLKRTGRLIMAIVHPQYLKFADGIKTNGFRSRFVHLAELKQYGVSNNMVSSMLCKFVPQLSLIAPALLFYDYPFMLDDKETRSDLFELVSHCMQAA